MFKRITIWAVVFMALSNNVNADSMTLNNQTQHDLLYTFQCDGYGSKFDSSKQGLEGGMGIELKWGLGLFSTACKTRPTVQLYNNSQQFILSFTPSTQQYGQKYYVHNWKDGNQCAFYVTNKDKNATPVDANDPGYFEAASSYSLPCK